MFLEVQECSYRCPACRVVVNETVVTAVTTVFTAPAVGVHAAVGHTAVLCGMRWMVRCGDDKALHRLPDVRLVAGRLADGCVPTTSPSEPAKKVPR